ncbi:MAG TPA: hypothetical protein VJ602_12475 [Paludibacter sp.]|nr:hypothetical protein [Paludibacter sp.]
MKQLALAYYAIFLLSCNQNKQIKSNATQDLGKSSYAKDLIANGFLKYADSSKIDSLQIQLTNSFDIYGADNFKIVHIDAEELAEFNFDFFLPNVNRILAKRNVKVSARKLNDKENSFDALINSDTIGLFDQKDLDNNAFLDTAPKNFFLKVNEMLTAKNIDEQFYLLYGGNDLHAILLTDKQLSIIANYYKNEPKEIPYKP